MQLNELYSKLNALESQKYLIEREIQETKQIIEKLSPFSKQQKIALFKSLFVAREDVYPIYWISKDGTKKGYSPVAYTFRGKDYIPISELGDGLKRFIFMLLAFYKVGENGYIFIDEIENGIWYKNYDLLWKNLFYLSNLFNTQLFITTHSKELIQSFLRVSKKEDFDDLALIELVKKEDKIDYLMFNQDTLELELENDFEVRG